MAHTTHTIAIIGPGAIGCLFGAMLAEAGHRITMLDKHLERAEKIKRDGIHVEGISGERRVKVDATVNSADIGACDLVVIATKSYDTEEAVRTVAGALGPTTPVLTLQNGLGNVEAISRAVGDERTIGGITAHGATLVGDGSIVHAGKGKTIIGTPSNERTGNLLLTKRTLDSAGFEPQIAQDLEATIWSKLVVNVGINALTAITRLNNGRLIEFEGTHGIMKHAVREAVAVADAAGITLPQEDPLAQVEEVCRLTATNVSSMLQDVLARRRTEIVAINGAVARLGAQCNIPTPVNETLFSLVRTIESSYDLQRFP
jgi:2-dehydropantoate 2-reductase